MVCGIRGEEETHNNVMHPGTCSKDGNCISWYFSSSFSVRSKREMSPEGSGTGVVAPVEAEAVGAALASSAAGAVLVLDQKFQRIFDREARPSCESFGVVVSREIARLRSDDASCGFSP
jgi:hypothetical protein